MVLSLSHPQNCSDSPLPVELRTLPLCECSVSVHHRINLRTRGGRVVCSPPVIHSGLFPPEAIAVAFSTHCNASPLNCWRAALSPCPWNLQGFLHSDHPLSLPSPYFVSFLQGLFYSLSNCSFVCMCICVSLLDSKFMEYRRCVLPILKSPVVPCTL